MENITVSLPKHHLKGLEELVSLGILLDPFQDPFRDDNSFIVKFILENFYLFAFFLICFLTVLFIIFLFLKFWRGRK